MDNKGKRRFYVSPENIVGDEAVIQGADLRHITQVMRYHTGNEIVLVDGRGGEYVGTIIQMDTSTIRIQINQTQFLGVESPLHLTVVQAFLKEKKIDDLLRPLTELGMNTWAPLIAERSVSRPDANRLKKRYDRWQKILIEGIKQSERTKVPELLDPVNWRQLISDADEYDLNLIFFERGGLLMSVIREKYAGPIGRIRLVFGPEGGFSSEEVSLADSAGFVLASLGPRILRSETAAVAGTALVQSFFGDL